MKIPLEHYAAGETLYNRMAAPVCEAYHLTNMEFTVLMFLANNPQYDTAAKIVQIRRVTKSHVSVSVRSLQERGLLRGEHRGNDHRSICLRLTEASEPIIAAGRQMQNQFSDILLTGFTPAEKDILSQYLDRIDRNIETHLNQNKKEQENLNG